MVALERLSCFLSFLLCHQAEDIPLLSFDDRGFVYLRDLADRVQDRFPDVREEELLEVIEGSDKKRFELWEGMVRATYGHSFPVDFENEMVEPPQCLYHGTARDMARTILQAGLRPRGRHYVHPSSSIEEALSVGQRRDPLPTVLIVRSQAAHADRIHFYHTGPLILPGRSHPYFCHVVGIMLKELLA